MSDFEVLSDESYKELVGILEWFSHIGYIPCLIGGWAVFVYNSYFGSVDIDLVGPSMNGRFLDCIIRYERINNYELVQSQGLGIEVAYRKPVTKNGKLSGHVEIDVCTYENDVGGFHESPEAKLPYSLCNNTVFLKEVSFNDKAIAHVPRKALLFLYKIKAFRDRSHDLKTKGAMLSPARRQWLETKIEKDGADLMALLDPKPTRHMITDGLDFGLLNKLLQQQRLQFVLDTVKKLPTLRNCLARHPSLETETVEKWVEQFFEKIEK